MQIERVFHTLGNINEKGSILLQLGNFFFNYKNKEKKILQAGRQENNLLYKNLLGTAWESVLKKGK